MPELRLSRATVADMRRILRFIDETAATAQWPERDHFYIKLAVEEAAANVFEHGYQGQPGPLHLAIESNRQQATILVQDWGIAFDPTQMDLPASMEESLSARSPGGLGLHFIFRIADEVHYHRAPDESNNLRLVKAFEQR